MTAWIEAMRLRTLPVSVAGVFAAVAMAVADRCFHWVPAALCLAFAVLAQIASNFANEYYDFKSGLDKPGRDGPRRGVTEGDITPEAMKRATYGVLGLACCIGLSLIYWGGWWLLLAGVVIAIGAVAYSAGPYPLSRHALGEVAVLFFFGIIPVNLTYYVQSGCFTPEVGCVSVAFGVMGANVLLVNNYRDADDDRAVGKVTVAVRYGRPFALLIYVADALVAALLLYTGTFIHFHHWVWAISLGYCALSVLLAYGISRTTGPALNPYLGRTAVLMLLTAIALICAA
ncbi:MAG: 1,4-dihydroxy-2-naphthoate octaprenyltransferase [Bacteroidales bacterium]|nr:1,4-dihydroxy-2-naphthoate octaprenyltransferase [Bacteroidales bacterium]